jgi:hypothetical protein
VLRTFHPSGRIHKIGLNAPQGHEQPKALRQPIITRRWLATFRAFASHAPVSFQANLDAPGLSSRATESDLLINKTRKMLNPVQNCLNFQLHCWPLVSLFRRSLPGPKPKVSFFSPSASRINQNTKPAPFHSQGRASGGNELSNSSSRCRRSPRVTDSPRPCE